MDLYSSGEELIKTRKPYTITKQRERWTEDEHNRFIEALKLYGRAWQRIEEHIGTKTAVQIRSHAQKFFTKLEKEALAKGVPVRQAIDIEIPPPRPKRKPSNPYPRKVGLKIPPQVAEKDGKQATSVSLQFGTNPEKEVHPEKNTGEGKLEKTDDDVQICSEGFSLSQEAVSSANGVFISRPPNNIKNSCKFREIVPPPTLEEVTDHGETNESYMTVETKEEHGNRDVHGIQQASIFGKHENNVGPGNCNVLSSQNYYPRHVPVHIVDGMSAKKSVPFQESTPPNQTGEVINLAAAASASTLTCNNATVPAFHPPFVPFQEDHISSSSSSLSSFSNLVVSSLLQNPAAHAAAHAAATSAAAAATFWHSSANMESASCAPSILFNSGMAAIATATVAAATAWWAAHGLLPLCAPPPPPPFALFTTAVDNSNNNNQATASEGGVSREDKTDDAQHQSSEALLNKHTPSSSDRKLDPKEEAGPVAAEHHDDDSCKTKHPKPVDPSSCGSNTTSSSEIETDALEKQGQDKQETLPCNDSTFRWTRGSISPNPNESWKEVSEEGRLAFEALFSREVLPQSFSPPYDDVIKDQQKINEGASQLDLNRRSCWAGAGERNGLLAMGLGNMKLKVHHTGFKPYKRCSVEAKEINKIGSCQNDEKLPKRMRLEGQAPST